MQKGYILSSYYFLFLLLQLHNRCMVVELTVSTVTAIIENAGSHRVPSIEFEPGL